MTFKKADYQFKIETSIFASQPHIKMERLSSGPFRALLSQFPSGDTLKDLYLSNESEKPLFGQILENLLESHDLHAADLSFYFHA